MIPKKIHYCWFGHNPLPASAKKCIKTWKKYCPDFEIIEWNESNYDIQNACNFVQKAYNEKKWAFVTDYVRLDVLNRYGGIYFDTDIELIKPITRIFDGETGYFGFENIDLINTGLGFCSEATNPVLQEMMHVYENFPDDITISQDVCCPVINTKILQNHGLILNNQFQNIASFRILPSDYLCPVNYYSGKRTFTDNTVSISRYDESWLPFQKRLKMKFKRGVKRILPENISALIGKIIHGNNGE